MLVRERQRRGFRVFEKYAIEIGGGDPHRFNLADAVLIKDNHIAVYGDLEGLIKLIKERTSFTKKVEVEVSTYEDAIRAYRQVLMPYCLTT